MPLQLQTPQLPPLAGIPSDPANTITSAHHPSSHAPGTCLSHWIEEIEKSARGDVTASNVWVMLYLDRIN
jgi:hypothetical protein